MSNVLATNGSFVPPADIDTNAKQLCKETERIIGVRGDGEEGYTQNEQNKPRQTVKFKTSLVFPYTRLYPAAGITIMDRGWQHLGEETCEVMLLNRRVEDSNSKTLIK